MGGGGVEGTRRGSAGEVRWWECGDWEIKPGCPTPLTGVSWVTFPADLKSRLLEKMAVGKPLKPALTRLEIRLRDFLFGFGILPPLVPDSPCSERRWARAPGPTVV